MGNEGPLPGQLVLYHFDFQMHLFCGNIKDAISPKSLDIIWRFLCPRK